MDLSVVGVGVVRIQEHPGTSRNVPAELMKPLECGGFVPGSTIF